MFSSLGFSQQIKINIDYANSQIRSKRVELGLEVNKGVNFNGNVPLYFEVSIIDVVQYFVNITMLNDINIDKLMFFSTLALLRC